MVPSVYKVVEQQHKYHSLVSLASQTSVFLLFLLIRKMMLSNASTVLQIIALTISIPSLLINILLIISIRRERRTENRFRWFNSIFLYSVYSNTLLIVLFPLFHSTLIPARSVIYIVFIGPLAGIFNSFLLKLLFSVLVGIVTYQSCVVPITLVLRWLVVQKFVYCTILHYKVVRVLFLVTSLPLPIAISLWTTLVSPSQMLESYSEESQEDAVRKLMGDSHPFFAVDWNFCYLLLSFIVFYLIFFLISFSFHHLYMRSIWNVSNDCIDLGYHHAATINQTLLSMAFQNLVFVTFPHLFLTFTVIIRWEMGIRAIGITFGAIIVPFTTAITLFLCLRGYRRQVGHMIIDLLRRRKVNIPIFITDPHQSTHIHVSYV
uniref:G_PROTEIN_RECEP_F1_2 domain-containing protein n=2 Tax=Caenorhabditis tropicalis TaxID=1561998 RepID=A0A1I7TW39_9PELO